MSNYRNPFVRLDNEKFNADSFRTTRNLGGAATVSEIAAKVISEAVKEKFAREIEAYGKGVVLRSESKTILPDIQIDYIELTFYQQFTQDLQDKFANRYGLALVTMHDFNTRAIVEVVDADKFDVFIAHVNRIVESPKGLSYQGQDFNIIVTIKAFKFFNSEMRMRTLSDDVTIQLDHAFGKAKAIQRKTLLGFLDSESINYTSAEDALSLTVRQVSRDILTLLADNFDIILAITSSKVLFVRPGIGGPSRDYGFDHIIGDHLPVVGLIDSGVSNITPYTNLIEGGIDLTGLGSGWDEMQHGTAVAGIILFGEQFYTSPKRGTYDAMAKLVVIKAIHNANDPLDIHKIIDAIVESKNEYGVRLFNLSLNVDQFKKYNERCSKFAYELDKVAFEEDVLVFISAGNFAEDNLNDILSADDPDGNHQYPLFFDNPASTSEDHLCEDTNIFAPAESMNNITVGALAGNLDYTADNSDWTPVKEYPAYYTRKFHYDSDRAEQDHAVKFKMKNYCKPDFIFDGGDYADSNSAIEVLTTIENGGYIKTSGTSLATPFITSYAAQILKEYPDLRTQTIKAILINNAQPPKLSHFPAFQDHPKLLKKLTGYGTPQMSSLISSGNNSITYIIEDEIQLMHFKKIPIHLPKRLQHSGNKLQFDIALSFSFLPKYEGHSDYLPFHLSFGLFQNLSIEDLSQGVISKGPDTSEETPIIGVKNSITWGEDFFGMAKRIPSNAQKRVDRIQPKDFAKLNNQIALAVRSYADADYRKLNPLLLIEYSLVVTITELCENANDSTLYTDMLDINNYVSINADLQLDLDN